MAHPQTWLEETKHAKEAQQVIFSQNKKPTFIPHPRPPNPSPPTTPLKVQKLTWEEMVECQLKGLFYNCDEKYFPGHKCKEKNFLWPFQRMFLMNMLRFHLRQVLPQEDDLTPPSDPPEVEPLISLNALTGFSAPQTLKLIGYIKHRKVIILVDSGSTHNFIHHCLSQEINCLYPCCQQFSNHDFQWWFHEMWGAL
jgi:hypothetical protein